jgi:hypothetical protein
MSARRSLVAVVLAACALAASDGAAAADDWRQPTVPTDVAPRAAFSNAMPRAAHAPNPALLRRVPTATPTPRARSRPTVEEPAIADEVADALGVPVAAVQAFARSGRSYADVAVAAGRTRAELLDALVQAGDAAIDRAVTAHAISPTRAAALRRALPARLAHEIDRRAVSTPTPRAGGHTASRPPATTPTPRRPFSVHGSHHLD